MGLTTVGRGREEEVCITLPTATAFSVQEVIHCGIHTRAPREVTGVVEVTGGTGGNPQEHGTQGHTREHTQEHTHRNTHTGAHTGTHTETHTGTHHTGTHTGSVVGKYVEEKGNGGLEEGDGQTCDCLANRSNVLDSNG